MEALGNYHVTERHRYGYRKARFLFGVSTALRRRNLIVCMPKTTSLSHRENLPIRLHAFYVHLNTMRW